MGDLVLLMLFVGLIAALLISLEIGMRRTQTRR